MRVTFVIDGYDNVPEFQQERIKDTLHSMSSILLYSDEFDVTSVASYKRSNFCHIDYERIDYEKKKKKKKKV